LTHVSDGESTKRWVIGKGLNAHWLGRDHLYDGSITGLDELGEVLNGFTSSSVDLLEDGVELACNVCSVAVENWRVSVSDLSRVVEDNDLGSEGSSLLGRVVLGVTADVSSSDILDGNVLDVETNVVTWETSLELLVVHLDGLDFGGDSGRSEGDDHTGLDGTGLDSADWDRSDTTNLVDILEWETERLVGGSRRGLDRVDGLEEGLSLGLARLGLLLPSLEPGHVGRLLQHVVSVPAGDGNEGNGLGVESDLLDEVGSLLDDFLVSGLGPLGGVHLVDGNDELTNTEGEGEEGVLAGLAILGDTSLELTSTGGDNENSAVGLGSSGNHVLDEITMSGSVNDGDIVLGSLELPESNVDGDTTFTLSLELVKNPCVLEGALAQLGGFLLELLDGSLVDTSALVDQVTGGGRLAGIDVSDDDDVNVTPKMNII